MSHIVFYTLGHRPPDVHSRAYVPVFYQAHLAKQWLDKMIGGLPHERTGNILWLNAGEFNFTIRCEQLDEVLSAPAANGELDKETEQWIRRFKYGTWDEDHKDVATADTLERSPKPVREPWPDKPDGYVSITELCETWNVLPRIARAALRASGRIRPAYGWLFPQNEVDAIKKLVMS